MSTTTLNRWPLKPLNELGKVARGKSRHRPRDDPSLYSGPYPFIQTGEVKAADLYITKYSQTYSEIGLGQSKLWEPGTLLITIAANIAETAILKFKACFPDSIVGFIADPKKSDVRFVKYSLDTVKLRMQNISRGTTQDNLPVEKLLSIPLPAPAIEVQRKIASILSAYDDLIENNTRRIQILEEMAQAIHREWFVNFCFPGHQKVRLVDSPLGKIPERWTVTALGKIASKIGSGATPRGGKEAYHDSGLSLIRSLNVYDNYFELENLAFIDAEQALQLDNVVVEKHDILLNITGASVARCCMVPSNILPARVNQHVTIIRINRRIADPFYVLCSINSEYHKSRLLAMAYGGATREALTKETVSNFEVVLPPRSILEDFSSIVADMFERRELLQRKIDCLRKSRDMLLPKLISGEVDVSNLNIETGEVAA